MTVIFTDYNEILIPDFKIILLPIYKRGNIIELKPKYSVIIPTLNEEGVLGKTLQQLKSLSNNHEVIVTDGGSIDNTIKIAAGFNAAICIGEKGRGKQLIKGTSCSKGDVLIYLHADTLLPGNAFELIDEMFANDDVKIASFRMKFDYNHPLLKLYSFFTRFDSFFTNFGDQVIVIKRIFYDKLNGFAPVKMFEDVDLLRRVRKKTKVYKIPAYVITSARRFLKVGVFKMQVKNLFYLMKFLAGFDKDKIYNEYFGNK